MSKANLWPSCTGTIVRMEQRRGPKALFATLTIECVSKDGKTSFRRDAIAFDNENDTTMTDLLNAGVGARIYARGPIQTAMRETASGAKFRVTTMTVRGFKVLPPMEVTETAQDTATETVAEPAAEQTTQVDTLPALPEGATEETHTLYTKRDGAKAWRKKTAAQLAKAQAAAVAEAEVTEVVAEAETPAVVETADVETPAMKASALDAVATAGEDTAMAAAFKAALAA